MDTIKDRRREFALLTAQIAAAYLSNHPLAVAELARVISSVHAALRETTAAAKAESPLAPKVPVRRSVTPDYLVCLEDGMHVKMLKRHLRTRHNLTPEQYRAKWGLAGNYPMVAPNYAEARSVLARSTGLGRRREPIPSPHLRQMRSLVAVGAKSELQTSSLAARFAWSRSCYADL